MLRGADFLAGRMQPYLEVIDDSAAAKVLPLTLTLTLALALALTLNP